MELDEATLVARARDRDVAAFEVLMRRYQRRIYVLCLRMLSGATGMVAHAVTEVVPAVAGVRVDTIRVHIAEVEVDLV